MKGIKEYTIREEKLNELKSILSLFQFNEMFKSTGTDGDVISWISTERKNIADGKYDENTRDALDVAITKLDTEVAKPENEMEPQEKDLLMEDLRRLKWAANTLQRIANQENIGALDENSQEARDFIEAQNVLANAAQVRERFDTFNEVSGFKNVKEDYFQLIDRFLSTCETVKFDMDDLEYKVDVDKAYDEVIARKQESENITTNIYNGINTEVEATINDSLNPEKILNSGYRNEVQNISNTMLIEKNSYGEEIKNINKELQNHVKQSNEKEIELCEERKKLEAKTTKIIEMMLKDELAALNEEEKEEIDSYNKNINVNIEDIKKSIEEEVKKLREEEDAEILKLTDEEFLKAKKEMDKNILAFDIAASEKELKEKELELQTAKNELDIANKEYDEYFAPYKEKYTKAYNYIHVEGEERVKEKAKHDEYEREIRKTENSIEKIKEKIPEKFKNDFAVKVHVLSSLTHEMQPRLYANMTLYQNIDKTVDIDPSIYSNPSKAADNIKKYLETSEDKTLDKNVFGDYTKRDCLEYIADEFDMLRASLAYTYFDMSKQYDNFDLDEFDNSKEGQTALAKADAKIAEIAKNGKGNILEQIASEIDRKTKEVEASFSQLDYKYNEQLGKIVQNESKDPLVAMNAYIKKQANIFDKKAYFSKEDLNDNGSIKMPKGTFKRFSLTTDRDSLTSITIGRVLDNIRASGKASAAQYAEAFDPQKLVKEKNTFAKKVIEDVSYGLELSEMDKKKYSTVEAQQNILKERTLNAKEFIGNDIYTGMKACIDIIDDRMKELNGEFSLQTFLKPENSYLFSVADTLYDLYQEFEKEDIKKVFINKYEEPKGKLPKNAANDISTKATAVCNLIKTMNNAMFEINNFALSDYSKKIPDMEASKLFYEIAQIKGIESNVSELINKNKVGGLFGINKKFNKKFSDLVSEQVLVDKKNNVYANQSQIITWGVANANSVISSDLGSLTRLATLKNVDKNGVCGINLVARNFLLNPTSVPGMGYKYDPIKQMATDVSIANFLNYTNKLNLSKPTKENPIKNISENHNRLQADMGIKPLVDETIQKIHSTQKKQQELYEAQLKSDENRRYIAKIDKITDMQDEKQDLSQSQFNKIEREYNNLKKVHDDKLKEFKLEYEKLLEKASSYGFEKVEDVDDVIKYYNRAVEEKRLEGSKRANALKEKNSASKEKIEKIRIKKEEIKDKYTDKNVVREVIDKKVHDLRDKVSGFVEESISKRCELETKKNLYEKLQSTTDSNNEKVIESYKKYASHSNKFLELKEMDDNRIQNNKTVVTTANTKLNALQNEEARLGRFINKLNDFSVAIEKNRDMDHKDTNEFTRMKDAIDNARRASNYAEMKTALTELQTATSEYIRIKNKWFVPKAFASEMRYSRLTAAGNIANFCKKAIDNCAKYESEKLRVCGGFMNENGSAVLIQNTVANQIKEKSREYIRENNLNPEVLNNSCKVKADQIIDEHKNTVKTLKDNLEVEVKESISKGLSKDKEGAINVIMSKYDSVLKKVADVQKVKNVQQPDVNKKIDVIENPKVQRSLN